TRARLSRRSTYVVSGVPARRIYRGDEAHRRGLAGRFRCTDALCRIPDDPGAVEVVLRGRAARRGSAGMRARAGMGAAAVAGPPRRKSLLYPRGGVLAYPGARDPECTAAYGRRAMGGPHGTHAGAYLAAYRRL